MANAPNYPTSFPDDLKPSVTAADAEGRRIFRRAAEDLRRAPGYDYNDTELKGLFKNRALAIASVATQQLCAAVKAGRRRTHSAHDDLEHIFADCISRTNWDAREFANRKLSDDQEFALKMDLETSEEYVQHVKAITGAGNECLAVPSPVRQGPIQQPSGLGQTQQSEGSAADLPELSVTIRRKLKPQWDGVVDGCHLTKEDIDRYSSASPVTRQLATSRVPDIDIQIPRFKEWLRSYQQARQASGLFQSEAAARERFAALAAEYSALWASSGTGYETYANQLEVLKPQVLAEIATVWRARSESASTWWETACAPAVERAISAVARERVSQARDIELRRMGLAETSGSTKTGNPILDEIHARGNDSETLRALIENGGQGLSPAAQKATRMAGQILPESEPSSPTMPERGARGSEEHIAAAPPQPTQDPIDLFKLPPELCSLLSAAEQNHVMNTIVDVDIRLFKDDPELERGRIRGAHLWPVFDAIATPLQNSPNFRETLLREFIPRMVEQIRKDMKWYPVFGILDNELYLAPCIREWRHAPKKVAESLDQCGEFLVETGPQHGEQGAVEDVRTTDQSPRPPAEVPAERGERKGDLKLLQKNDGSLYESVTFPTAEAYADISDRRRQQLMGDGTLEVVGKGQNRRITVASLTAYCPPSENPK